ncbi:protein of unknown function (plasmid) [Cardinium endosymbiont cEper1 of Encarsia pergandiella]|nr:protein of unknown function [Cardinium endosymbiont cEper1 of Encarsia pergandiella]
MIIIDFTLKNIYVNHICVSFYKLHLIFYVIHQGFNYTTIIQLKLLHILIK